MEIRRLIGLDLDINILKGLKVDINLLIQDVLDEIDRAEAKFPRWPIDPLHALAILNEEVGELNKAVLQGTYDGLSVDDLVYIEEEAIQVAAMAIRFIKGSDKYEYKPSEQTLL